MQSFENVIDSLINTRVGIDESFLHKQLYEKLRENFLVLLDLNKFNDAGVGNNSRLTQNKLIRSDKIYWLDRKHNDIYENSFFDLIDRFVLYLNETCYTGITGYEFHYAWYDEGSYYTRHLDQFQNNKKRAYSMIMYLNEDWVEIDGGQLCIYHLDHCQLISPNSGKCVLFKSSEMEHEVLLCHKPRMSITGWLLSQ